MTQFRIQLIHAFILFSISMMASSPDSLVQKEDLSFHSNLEKIAFESIKSEKGPNLIYLLVAIDEKCDADKLNGIRREVAELSDQYKNNSKFIKLKEEKKIKKIYADIQAKYLNKFGQEYYFSNIISDGIYNSVSAAALFGLLLNDLQIPYVINYSYDQVSILAYPQNLKIPLTFGDPAKENAQFDEQTKQQFVDYMAEAGEISQSDKNKKSVDELFNEIYYKEAGINLTGLAGLQYYKRAVDLMNYEQYEEAFILAEKSYYLYPSNDAGYLLLICLANALIDCKYEDIHFADYIYKGARYKNYGISNEDVISQFADVTNVLLINENNTTLYDAYYNRIIKHLTDSTQIREVSFTYNYERGRVLIIEDEYMASVEYLEKAYNLKPKNVDALNMFLAAVMQSFWQLKTPEEALHSINQYAEKYPAFTEDTEFNTMRGALLLAMSLHGFEMDQSQEAFDKIADFEALAGSKKLNSDNLIFSDLVEEVYSRAASYYYRKSNMKQAKNYLERGLTYAPNSYKLKSKVNSLKY